jgi:hypothetical protein
MVLYAKYSDNVARNATITVVSGTEDPAYPAAQLANDNPALPAKLLTTSGTWLFTYAAAQRVDGIVLVHANLQTGLAVRLRGRTSAGGGDVISELITIPAYHGDKFPANAVLDISGLVSGTAASGYTTTGLQYWLVDIVGTNAVTVSIGEVLLVAQWRQFALVQNNVVMRPRRPVIDNKTAMRVKSTYDLGVTVWEFDCELLVTGSTCDDLDALWEDGYGKVRPWTWWPIATASTSSEAFLVTFVDDAKDLTYRSQTSAVRLRAMKLRLEEVGRGLIPTPSAV